MPSPSGQDDLVARTDFEGVDGALQRCRARGDRERVSSLYPLGEFPLEGRDFQRLNLPVPTEGALLVQHFGELLALFVVVILCAPVGGTQGLAPDGAGAGSRSRAGSGRCTHNGGAGTRGRGLSQKPVDGSLGQGTARQHRSEKVAPELGEIIGNLCWVSRHKRQTVHENHTNSSRRSA
jgi:hypothetical protein